MDEVTTVGVDLAKEVIVVCAANRAGRAIYFRQFSFQGFAEWAVQLAPCRFGLEACSSAHHWARWLVAHGHQAQLMAAELVSAFRKSRGAKNDRNDAEAILTALRDPNMRFVAVKSVEQQSMLAWHRMRQGYKHERTALSNRIRGLLAEFGIWIGRSPAALCRSLLPLAQGELLPAHFRPLLLQAHEQLQRLDACIHVCEQPILQHARQNADARRISEVSGIGPLTASALIATVANATDFRNGRQLAAWLGLVPRQSSSGGKQRLGVITKRGDAYLRGLLTQGARSAMQVALKRPADKRSRLQQWIVDLHARVGYHKTLVAIANKHARWCWAMLAHEQPYDPNAWQQHATAAA